MGRKSTLFDTIFVKAPPEPGGWAYRLCRLEGVTGSRLPVKLSESCHLCEYEQVKHTQGKEYLGKKSSVGELASNEKLIPAYSVRNDPINGHSGFYVNEKTSNLFIESWYSGFSGKNTLEQQFFVKNQVEAALLSLRVSSFSAIRPAPIVEILAQFPEQDCAASFCMNDSIGVGREAPGTMGAPPLILDDDKIKEITEFF